MTATPRCIASSSFARVSTLRGAMFAAGAVVARKLFKLEEALVGRIIEFVRAWGHELGRGGLR